MKCIIAPYPAPQNSGLDGYRMVADSAVGRDSMPLFVPDLGLSWRAELALAFRVCRLGKNVTAKFAMRYIDAISTPLLLMPAEDHAPQWLAFAEGAITTGTYLPLDLESDIEMHASVETLASPSVLGETSLTYRRDEVVQTLTQAVTTASQAATIKTGDLLVPSLPRMPLPLALDTRITASIGLSASLSLKIK